WANGNQIRCYNCKGVGHYAKNCTVKPRRRDAAYLQTQLLIAQTEEAGIQIQAEEYDPMAAAADLDEIEEVNANCILMANLQQALTSGTQTDSAPVYDTDGSAEVHANCDNNEIFNMLTQEEQYIELLEPIPESHQVPQNDNDVISEDTSVEQDGKIVEQHPANFEETRALYESLYQNLVIEVEKVIHICLWCVDSGCSKHMIGNLKLLINFVWKFMGTVRFGNDHVAAILGFGDLQWGNILITRVYFVEGLGHNLFSQNGVVERRNRTLVEAARTMLIFSRAPLFLWAEAIATACFTQNRSIIHHIGMLGAKGDIGFFIGYSADSCAYRIYNRRTKKIMETMNVSFDEFSAMAFKQRSLKPRVQSMTSRQISSELNLTYAPSTITSQQPTEGELDLLFKAMYDDYIGG
nr:ribonuclease H-like domain-containing protein [Tanacetum cinerariifolium]